MENTVFTLSEVQTNDLVELLARYQLELAVTQVGDEIPGSYWGDSEAGLIGNTVYARNDTPIHSILHEGCHYICMDSERRDVLDTNAEGDYDEENGVCFLQILLARELAEIGQERMLQDMDSWGYTFRLGSAKKWFEEDAEDAKDWLMKRDLITLAGNPTFMLRQ